MDDNGDAQGHGLAEAAREQNSNLRRLIDAVGALIAASRELMQHLQLADGAERPAKDDPATDNAGSAGPPKS
ncbi:MAG: hypothetical protein K2X43_09220 [Hyphomonadaceae bacterium]|nr:hypothetical protein [Hyphomonadaceae bacterium]